MKLRTTLAAAGILGAIATAGLASTAQAATSGASDTAGPATASCSTEHGKFYGKIVKTYRIIEGRNVHGGTLQVWRSVKCQTAWTRVVKTKKYAKRRLLTVAAIRSYDAKHHRWNKPHTTEVTIRGTVESPAIHAVKGTRLQVSGGFLADYQFDQDRTYVLKH